MTKLKCWKKTTDYKSVKTYKKIKGKDKHTISFGEMSNWNKTWGVIVSQRKKNQKILAEDTTKQRAVDIANKYMKEHDKC